MITTSKASPRQPIQCNWTQEADSEIGLYYDTSCEAAYVIDVEFENLDEVDFNFCPNCGGAIVIIDQAEG